MSNASTTWSFVSGPITSVATPVFRGDQKHHYANIGTGEAIAYSVIAFNPLG